MMDEMGLWKLFFATGLPEVYLAIQGERAEQESRLEMRAKTAFQPEKTLIQQI